MKAFEIHEEDLFLVMASDGVWDELDNQTVVDIINSSFQKGESVENTADIVVQACLAHAASKGIEVI